MSSVASLAGPAGDELRRAAADQRRVSKAALDFEGLLLASWMEAAEQANRDLSGDHGSARRAGAGLRHRRPRRHRFGKAIAYTSPDGHCAVRRKRAKARRIRAGQGRRRGGGWAECQGCARFLVFPNSAKVLAAAADSQCRLGWRAKYEDRYLGVEPGDDRPGHQHAIEGHAGAGQPGVGRRWRRPPAGLECVGQHDGGAVAVGARQSHGQGGGATAGRRQRQLPGGCGGAGDELRRDPQRSLVRPPREQLAREDARRMRRRAHLSPRPRRHGATPAAPACAEGAPSRRRPTPRNCDRARRSPWSFSSMRCGGEVRQRLRTGAASEDDATPMPSGSCGAARPPPPSRQ